MKSAIRCGSLLLSSCAIVARLSAQHMPGEVVGYGKLSAADEALSEVLQANDGFGRSITLIGDLNGDGLSDIAVGAPGGPGSGGGVFVLFLDASGGVLGHQRIGSEQVGGALDDLDGFGYSVACIGDLDGDSVVDLAVGAIGDDDGFANSGALWILFLHQDGTVKAWHKISATSGDISGQTLAGDWFGSAVAPIPDLDHDGVREVAVSAMLHDAGGSDTGAVWVLFLRRDGSVKCHQKIALAQGGFEGRIEDLDMFGSSLASLSPSGPARARIAVGAHGDDDGGGAVGFPGYNGNGAVWILSLASDGTVLGHQKISMGHGGFEGDLEWVDGFGSSVAYIGDLDGDGIGDLAVGARNDADGSPPKNAQLRGAVWIVFLRATGEVKRSQKISQIEGGFSGAFYSNELFGSSVSALQDLNADGVADLAVGAIGDKDGGAPYVGAVWLLFLRAGVWSKLPSQLERCTSRLAGTGTLVAGEETVLLLSGADKNVPCLLTVGLRQVPNPGCSGVISGSVADFIIVGETNNTGGASFHGRWPDGLPSGTQVFFQVLTVAQVEEDSCFKASNGVVGTTP